jgi:hypothetical protein
VSLEGVPPCDDGADVLMSGKSAIKCISFHDGADVLMSLLVVDVLDENWFVAWCSRTAYCHDFSSVVSMRCRSVVSMPRDVLLG